MATLAIGYGPRQRLLFDGDKAKHELWETMFLGFMRLHKLCPGRGRARWWKCGQECWCFCSTYPVLRWSTSETDSHSLLITMVLAVLPVECKTFSAIVMQRDKKDDKIKFQEIKTALRRQYLLLSIFWFHVHYHNMLVLLIALLFHCCISLVSLRLQE